MDEKAKMMDPRLWLLFVTLMLLGSIAQLGLAITQTTPDPDHLVWNLHMLSGTLGIIAVAISAWDRIRKEKKQ